MRFRLFKTLLKTGDTTTLTLNDIKTQILFCCSLGPCLVAMKYDIDWFKLFPSLFKVFSGFCARIKTRDLICLYSAAISWFLRLKPQKTFETNDVLGKK